MLVNLTASIAPKSDALFVKQANNQKNEFFINIVLTV